MADTPPKQEVASPQLSEMLGRLRLLEERYANLRREHQVTSHNMIEHHQSLSKQQRRLQDMLVSIKRELAEINEHINMMKGELSESAKLHELKSLERYIDMWEPLSFITREEALKLIEEARGKAFSTAMDDN